MKKEYCIRSKAAPLKSSLTAVCALAAGVLTASISRQTSTDLPGSLLMLLLRPWTLLGEQLREWSLSGTQGNTAAWAVIIALSLLPTLFILFARKKRRFKSDLFFPLASIGSLVCLYLLINPSLCIHPLLAASTDAAFLGMTPALTLLSLLTVCILVRWADNLNERQPLVRLLSGMRLLLLWIMALTAASAGYVLTQSIQSIPLFEPQVYIPAPTFYNAASDAWTQLLLTVIDLLPDLFVIITLHHACSLCDAFGESGFQQTTERCAAHLARWAKHTLTAALLCMAARNAAAMLLGRFLANLSTTLTLPLVEMAFSCGTLLLARCLSAACRIQRENDLMI